MNDAERYKQDLDFFLDELKQKEGPMQARRAREALRKAWDLRLDEWTLYQMGVCTLEDLEESIEKKQKQQKAV